MGSNKRRNLHANALGRGRFSGWFTGAIAGLVLALPINAGAVGSLVSDPNFVDDLFENFIVSPCLTPGSTLFAQGWTVAEITRYTADICVSLFPGGFNNSSSYASTSNIGSVGAISNTSDSVAQQQVGSVKDRLDEIKEEDESRQAWGLLLSVQAGETERFSTDNEVGYDSELDGVVVGSDYRFNDQLIVGVALGATSDEADYDDDAGFLNTDSDTVTVYTTYIINDNSYVDGYIGYASLEYENSRDISITGDPALPISAFDGTVTSEFDGKQTMMGISYGYDWYPAGNASYGVIAAVDYARTEIDDHDEDGTTNLELSYEDQTTRSLTVTLGGNWSYSIDMGWGVLIPNANLSAVFQREDDADITKTRLSIMPTVVPFLELETDEPDSEYTQASVGFVIAMNSGTQYFLTYEEIFDNDFFDTWAISAGFLTEF